MESFARRDTEIGNETLYLRGAQETELDVAALDELISRKHAQLKFSHHGANFRSSPARGQEFASIVAAIFAGHSPSLVERCGCDVH